MAREKADQNTASDGNDVRMVGARRSPSQERGPREVLQTWVSWH